MSAPLVFVNYHVHNDDLKADRHLVSRHIGKYHRNRSKPSKPLSNGTIGGSIASHPGRRIAPKASPSVEQGEFQAAVSTSLREQPQPNSSIAGHRSLYRLPPLNASSQINPQRLDPFQSTVIPLTAEMEPVFMYYLNTIMPVVEPAPVERAEYQQWIVPLAMSDTALLYALLRCMALDIEQATVTNLGSSSRKFVYPDQFQYKTLATRALNESLANPIQAAKPSTMMAVHFWLWQEVRATNHIRVSVNLISALDRYFQARNVYKWMMFRSCSISAVDSQECSARLLKPSWCRWSYVQPIIAHVLIDLGAVAHSGTPSALEPNRSCQLSFIRQ